MPGVTASPGEVRVDPAESDVAGWDDFVRAAPGSSACHLLGWREVMEGVMGHEARYLIARDAAGELAGILPLVRVRARPLGDYLLSMPFLNDGGPVGDPAARAALAGAALADARTTGVGFLELRTRQPLVSALSRGDRKVSVHLALPDSREALWGHTFRAKLRSQIRRPVKEGMELRVGTAEVLPFYEVFARNMRDLGTPVLPREFFERLPRLFSDEVLFAAVYHKDEPVAAGCGFVWGDEFEITWASSLREHNRLAPNMLLYAGLMEHVIERGVRTFNFGRCTPGGSTHRFKLQWGGADVPLPWAQWSRQEIAGLPSRERQVFRLATAAWSRLPLPLANALGPVLSRRLP
jgi:serine/alanine adding enzyme